MNKGKDIKFKGSQDQLEWVISHLGIILDLEEILVISQDRMVKLLSIDQMLSVIWKLRLIKQILRLGQILQNQSEQVASVLRFWRQQRYQI